MSSEAQSNYRRKGNIPRILTVVQSSLMNLSLNILNRRFEQAAAVVVLYATCLR